jgi:hypothetical protein
MVQIFEDHLVAIKSGPKAKQSTSHTINQTSVTVSDEFEWEKSFFKTKHTSEGSKSLIMMSECSNDNLSL